MKWPALVAVMVALAPPAVAQEIQVDPAHPVMGDAVLLQTTVLGNVSWEFGDGQTASGRSVSHTFPYAGIYTIRVLQGGVRAADFELTVRIPESLYADAADIPTNATPPAPTPDTNETYVPGPVTPPGGFLHYLGEHPLVMILVLGTVVGGLMGAAAFIRKRRGQAETYAEDEAKPAVAASPPPAEESLEDLLPGAEEIVEEHPDTPPVVPDDEKPAEDDPMSISSEPSAAKPKGPASTGLDEADFARRLG